MAGTRALPDWAKPEHIEGILDGARGSASGPGYDGIIDAILRKAEDAEGLTIPEAALLLLADDPAITDKILSLAGRVKSRIYGERVVMFAPLYLSDHCVNECRYCGYKHSGNPCRSKLSIEEIASEVRVLETMGHKRLALECGEDPVNCPIGYVEEAIAAIYSCTEGPGAIRRVNVNIAATTVDDYKRLKAAGIGTYILFQETYHPDTYAWAHTKGPKADYLWHLTAMDRAMEAGLDDVGIGVLFGLHPWLYEVVAMLSHADHLEREFGCGPHTVSVPRLRPVPGMDLGDFPHLVSEDELLRIIAVLRLTLPYTGLILSTRESPEFRAKAIRYGISQLSAGSSTGVGGYSREDGDAGAIQFEVSDHRPVDSVVRELCESGYVPSFCTACYRKCRTGERFMDLAKTGEIRNVCLPNALLTLKEYMEDYASPETREAGVTAIKRHLREIGDPSVRERTEDWLEGIARGERDKFF